MKPLNIKQRKGESADMFAMRAWAAALPRITDPNHAHAAASWIQSYTRDKLPKQPHHEDNAQEKT